MSLSLTDIAALCGIVIAVITVFRLFYKVSYKVKRFILQKLQKKKDIENYFKSIIHDDCEIDYFFYQFGLRKTLPIMDWLYLEYIKFINKKSKIVKLVIFPTIDGSVSSQISDDFNELSMNINLLFENSGIEVMIINPYLDNYFKNKDLILKDFIESLKYIGSRRYFKFLWDNFRVRIRNISDFNKYHPFDDRILNIFTHIYKSWCIVRYIDKEFIQNQEKNISAIFWEWEVDKLGVIKYYLGNKGNINLFPVLGKTQLLNRKTPLPVFIEDKTICVFDDRDSTIKKAIKFLPFLSKYNIILESVFSEYEKIKKREIRNFGKSLWLSYKLTHDTETNCVIKETNDFFMFLGLIFKIRLLYGKDD